jgi:hypothetical protein
VCCGRAAILLSSTDFHIERSYQKPVLMQFDCGTRILRVIHGRDARATFANCISTQKPDR